MTSAQWRLSRQVVVILSADPGRTESDLAGRLGVTLAELRPVVGMLIGRGRLERCWDCLVLGPKAAGPANGAVA
jgi:hypothetical protein